jgi:hypothetical protein
MRKVWIEAALNGPWSRALQPEIPDTSKPLSRRASPARAPAPPSFTPTPMMAAARRPSTGRFTRALSRAFERKWTFRSIRLIHRS